MELNPLIVNQKHKLRFLVCPLLFLAMSYHFFFAENFYFKIFPNYIPFYSGQKGIYLPIPNNQSSSYLIGVYSLQYNITKNQSLKPDLLFKVGNLTEEYIVINETQLYQIYDNILLSETSGIGKVFNFINIIWFLSILGVVTGLAYTVKDFVQPLLEFLIINLFIPFWTYSEPLREPLAYLISLYFVVQGCRTGESQTSGVFISLTGLIGLVACFWLSSFLHIERQGGKIEVLIVIFSIWTTAIWAPTAVINNSVIIGIMSVGFLYSALFFSILDTAMRYMLRCYDEKPVYKTLISSFIFLVALFIIWLSGNINSYIIQPFSLGFQIMGTLVFYISLLNYTSYYSYSVDYQYQVKQVIMIVFLGMGVLLGGIANFAAIQNTAIVFCIIYILQKLGEAGDQHRSLLWPCILIGSAVVYFSCLYLNEHSYIISQMFGFSLQKNYQQ